MRIARDVSKMGIKIVAKASAIVVTPVFGIATAMQFSVKLVCDRFFYILSVINISCGIFALTDCCFSQLLHFLINSCTSFFIPRHEYLTLKHLYGLMIRLYTAMCFFHELFSNILWRCYTCFRIWGNFDVGVFEYFSDDSLVFSNNRLILVLCQ